MVDHRDKDELVLHLPAVDPARHRWFMVSVIACAVLVVGGWMYFLTHQVSALAQSVPRTFASDFLKGALNSTSALGNEAATNFKTTISPQLTNVIGQVQTQIQSRQVLGNLIDNVAAQVTATPAASTNSNSGN